MANEWLADIRRRIEGRTGGWAVEETAEDGADLLEEIDRLRKELQSAHNLQRQIMGLPTEG